MDDLTKHQKRLDEFIIDLQKYFTRKIEIILEKNAHDFGVTLKIVVDGEHSGIILPIDYWNDMWYMSAVDYVFSTALRHELLMVLKNEITKYLNESENNL